MVLAGNKCDIDSNQRKISKAMADELTEKHQMIQAETSAKTGEGIQELFKQVAERIVKMKR